MQMGKRSTSNFQRSRNRIPWTLKVERLPKLGTAQIMNGQM
jgi:hypothetical protein